jgi:hypothetical protein
MVPFAALSPPSLTSNPVYEVEGERQEKERQHQILRLPGGTSVVVSWWLEVGTNLASRKPEAR